MLDIISALARRGIHTAEQLESLLRRFLGPATTGDPEADQRPIVETEEAPDPAASRARIEAWTRRHHERRHAILSGTAEPRTRLVTSLGKSRHGRER